uniref:Probable Vpr-like protein n=18 Tax=Caprine arthritis encephalitis virus TaxID=11660 RepID=VPRL_CAEVC|nr:RecName: Full=Probable Vpr-like protein; AltName: Full=Protein S; AltName: Full=Protein Tat [Caprine arthritis encephalitis virus strain Cork]AAA42890.1 tat protein [Caprine arthritis encephalitis virus]
MSEELPQRRETHPEELVRNVRERERDTWQWTSIRVPEEILQRWLAMLRSGRNRKKVYREMQKWMWIHPKGPVIRACGCRLCNPGWGT